MARNTGQYDTDTVEEEGVYVPEEEETSGEGVYTRDTSNVEEEGVYIPERSRTTTNGVYAPPTGTRIATETEGVYPDDDTDLVDSGVYPSPAENTTLQGPKGDKGDKGDPGARGPIGPIGPQGLMGEKGDQGDRGDQGIQGVRGPAGPQGPRGNAFVYSDFTISQLAGLQGPRGPQGIQGPIGMRGPAFTYSDFTTNQLAALTGPQGPDGPVGPPGTQGPKGDRGDTGNTGSRGSKGDQGDQGIQGPRGIPGIQGPRGLEGPKGDTGGVGPQGQRGDVGPQGPKGDTGDTGDQGIQGIPGPQGIPGTPGQQGPQGIQGVKGDKGDPGAEVDLSDGTTTITSVEDITINGQANDIDVEVSAVVGNPNGADITITFPWTRGNASERNVGTNHGQIPLIETNSSTGRNEVDPDVLYPREIAGSTQSTMNTKINVREDLNEIEFLHNGDLIASIDETGLGITDKKITGVADPTNPQDAVNLRYFNANMGSGGTGGGTGVTFIQDTEPTNAANNNTWVRPSDPYRRIFTRHSNTWSQVGGPTINRLSGTFEGVLTANDDTPTYEATLGEYKYLIRGDTLR